MYCNSLHPGGVATELQRHVVDRASLISPNANQADHICAVVIGLLWLGSHAYFARRVSLAMQEPFGRSTVVVDAHVPIM